MNVVSYRLYNMIRLYMVSLKLTIRHSESGYGPRVNALIKLVSSQVVSRHRQLFCSPPSTYSSDIHQTYSIYGNKKTITINHISYETNPWWGVNGATLGIHFLHCAHPNPCSALSSTGISRNRWLQILPFDVVK